MASMIEMDREKFKMLRGTLALWDIMTPSEKLYWMKALVRKYVEK
jgi:hypothetical protein